MSTVAAIRADPSRCFFTMEDLAEYLRYGSPRAAYQWCRRHSVELIKRGNAVLVRLSEVDDALAGVDLTVRRAQAAAGVSRSFLKSHKVPGPLAFPRKARR